MKGGNRANGQMRIRDKTKLMADRDQRCPLGLRTVATHALALGELGKGGSKGRMEVQEKSK